ncbi:MAG: hypothetical protein U0229_03015 [Anaeromyxobacter sp.]
MSQLRKHPWARTLTVAAALAALAAAGAARAGSSTTVSGSVYVDEWWMNRPEVQKRSPGGVTIDGAVKIGVDISDDVAFSTKACMSCHGIELEHFQMEYMPKTWFNVQAGRLAIPFGEFANRVDQSGHKTVSAPLIYDMGRMAYGEKGAMNLGVLPLPYTDTGVMVYGQRFLGPIQAWYGVYGVAGLRGGNDADWTAMRALYYTDPNRVPSVGGRLALTLAAQPGWFLGDTSVGASYTRGRYDRDAVLGYEIWGVDASMQLGKVVVRGEYAHRRTDLSTKASYPYELVDPWFTKEGFYVEAEAPLGGSFGVVYRYDELGRHGVPLPGSVGLSTNSHILRHTAGILFTPAPSTFLKLGWEYWMASDYTDFHSVHLGVGGAF